MKAIRFSVGHGRTALIEIDDWCATFTYTFPDGSVITIRPCQQSWHINGTGTAWEYATCSHQANNVKRSISLHRLITGATRGQTVDHINGDSLDNRRSNLRIGTNAENIRNMRARGGTSKYKGVYLRPDKRWRAHITFNYKKMNLGNHITEESAAIAYNAKATELFGEYARLNVIENRTAGV